MANEVFKLMGKTEDGESFLVKSSSDKGELIAMRIQLECTNSEKEYWVETAQE